MNAAPISPGYRDQFIIKDEELCYLDGNSLGRLPKAAFHRVQDVLVEGWATQLIRGWNDDWIDLPQRLGNKLAKLLNASDGEVVVADSTSVNLFKLATAALRMQPERSVVLTDAANFPSDHYILESAIQAAGSDQRLRVVGQPEAIEISTDEVISEMDESTALVSLSHVAYKSGHIADMRAITEAAHRVGALVLWDLSHSVGSVPIDLSVCNADLAVGCTYKYLCGGPGSPAFLFCRKDLQPQLSNPIAGWFSHETPFTFDPTYVPASTIDRFLVGTPPVLSMAAIEAGLDLVLEAGMDHLRERSTQLVGKFLFCLAPELERLGFELRSPSDAGRRGSHITLGHAEARRITENLIQRHKVIPDFRTPDNLRLGIAPLYTTESEVEVAAAAIIQTVAKAEYESIVLSDAPVT